MRLEDDPPARRISQWTVRPSEGPYRRPGSSIPKRALALHWAAIDLRLNGKEIDSANEEIIMPLATQRHSPSASSAPCSGTRQWRDFGIAPQALPPWQDAPLRDVADRAFNSDRSRSGRRHS